MCEVTNKQTRYLNKSVGKNPSWKANICSAIQEIFFLLWNPEVNYRVQNSPSLDLTLSQMNPVHNLKNHFSKINFNIIH
jgi:hypothetical protein